MVHFFTPTRFERLCGSVVGGPPGIAFDGQPLEQALQISHISRTPNEMGRSWARGASVKIFPKRTLVPNSGVMTRPCLPYSPSPAWTAYGTARAVSFIDGTARYPRLRRYWATVSKTTASWLYPIPVAAPDRADGAVSMSVESIACPITITWSSPSGRSLGLGPPA